MTSAQTGEAIVARTGSWAAHPVMPSFRTMWPRPRQGAQGHVHQPRLPLDESANRYPRAYGVATAQDFAARLAAPKRELSFPGPAAARRTALTMEPLGGLGAVHRRAPAPDSG
ncbi:hypothetical protein ACFTWH_04980 [Streptomyces sp. NPDC057011]|uniref:hypothetical protein n=1 Tax=unclassified Streptomyces TaxID=2593676 RepID=UPI00363E68C9